MEYTASHDDIPEITLGWRLRIAMERADVKADDMARALGVHRGTITRWTHDIGKPPRPIYLEKWADICRVPLPWLAGDLARDHLARVGAGTGGDSGGNSRVGTEPNSGYVTTGREYMFEDNVPAALIAA